MCVQDVVQDATEAKMEGDQELSYIVRENRKSSDQRELQEYCYWVD